MGVKEIAADHANDQLSMRWKVESCIKWVNMSLYCVQSRRAAWRWQQPMHQFQSERNGSSASETDQQHHQQPVLLLNVLYQLLPSLPCISHRVRWPYV